MTARDQHIEEVVRSVEDPYEPGTTRPTGFNRRVDLLEFERSHARLTDQEYLIGRQLQTLFEKSSTGAGGSSWNPGDRVDAEAAKELSIIRAITAAADVKAMMKRVERELGPIDARMLRMMLGDRMGFAEYAAFRGYPSKHSTTYFAHRFRDALEALSNAFAARGPLSKEIRAHRVEDEEGVEEVETDAKGVQVRPGHGYRLSDDPAARWQPSHKRRKAEAVAERERIRSR